MLSSLNYSTIPRPSETLKDIIALLTDTFAGALNHRNIAAALDYFSADAVMITPDRPGVCGKPAIHTLLDSMFDGSPVTVSLQPSSVAQLGDLAVALGEYSLWIVHPQLGKWNDTGKFVTGWRRQPGGEYLMTVTIWSRSS